MKHLSGRGVVLFLSLLFSLLLGALMYLQDIEPNETLRLREGPIVSRVPITSKGKLTGFRICVGDEPKTFTYSDPDPRIEHAWAVVRRAQHVRVQYSERSGRNPELWGLEVNGEVLATPTELQEVRTARYYLYVAGFLVSVSVFGVSLVGSLRSRNARVFGART